jgi:RHH-type proline utilization regulon transcriptional repressor/proline dehydrogenase/delta 1-pyrroline-5-carboxylate dehydrogenase
MDIETKTKEFGRNIFKLIGQEQPATFNKKYISGKIMEWSMSKPDFKVNMFRLVDVLPTLQSSSSIAKHVNEYLSAPAKELSGFLEWGINVPPNSLRAHATSLMVKKSVNEMAKLFIAGEDAKSSIKVLKNIRKQELTFTVDLLGEYSVSEEEALAYLDRYMEALEILGKEVPNWKESAPIIAGHKGDEVPVNISVKLSALYSQCSMLNFDRTVSKLSERLTTIVSKAKEVNARLYVDAEDTATNPMILETFKRVFSSSAFKDFPYPGIVLQAYNKKSEDTLRELLDFSKKRGSPIAIRLVKGAYWDHEVISALQYGWEPPLFQKKESSDAQYEHLSRMLLDNTDLCLPAFGSHNVRSLSQACMYAESKGLTNKDFEMQMLYGMAEPIALAFRRLNYLVRLYVPLGEMLPGMGYLVRRLLENTSNESFLRHTFVDSNQIDNLLKKPEIRG